MMRFTRSPQNLLFFLALSGSSAIIKLSFSINEQTEIYTTIWFTGGRLYAE